MPSKAKTERRYIVANPRGIPAGKYILHSRIEEEDRYWFEGDDYDGPVTERLVKNGFIETPEQREARLKALEEANDGKA